MSVDHVPLERWGGSVEAHEALRVSASEVDAPPRIPARHEIDGRFVGYVGGSAIAVLFGLALLASIPPDVTAMYSDALYGETRLVRGEADRLLSGGGAGAATGTAAATGAAAATGTAAGTGTASAAPDVAPDADADADADAAPASRAGILSVLADEPAAIRALSGTADFDVQLRGNVVGEVAGAFGVSLRGVAERGGGRGWGTIGTGRYGLIGHGAGTGAGYCGPCPGAGGLRGRRGAAPSVRFGAGTAIGGLDKNIIRRYIRRSLARIKHCYDRRLIEQPGLSGTITTHFRITSIGTVQGVTASGFDDQVADCVADVIRSIRFPSSRGAGFADVTYPFIFKAAGI